MNFCENCNLLTKDSQCPNCGNKKVREAHDEDFCLFANLDSFHSETFEAALSEHGIESVAVPYYSQGVTYGTAGRANYRHVFIRYKNHELAKEIYRLLSL